MMSSIALDLLKKEEERRMPNREFFARSGAYVKLRYVAMLYSHSIGNKP